MGYVVSSVEMESFLFLFLKEGGREKKGGRKRERERERERKRERLREKKFRFVVPFIPASIS